jgi:ribosomal protein S18 acetylase RimI-like enzyme
MQLTMRACQTEDDYWRMRAFLRALYLRNGRREWSWQPYRLDYWRWHGTLNLGHGPLMEKVFLWESAESELVAILNSEAPGIAYLQLAADHRSRPLLAEMVTVAQRHLSVTTAAGRHRLLFVCLDDDQPLQAILSARGFQKLSHVENYHARSLLEPLPAVELPAGYTIRALRDEADLPARSWLSWRAFHPDELDSNYEGWDWYLNIQRAPLYRRELDLVVEAPAGELAAFATIWFDDATRTGAFEPVGTHPDYQRRGLGRALLTDGMQRLHARGATLATVGSGAPGPCAFYESLGLIRTDRAELWKYSESASP